MKLTHETLVMANPEQILLPRFTVSQIMRNDQQVSFRFFFTANHDTFDKNDYIVVKYARINKDGYPLTNKGIIQYFKPKTRPVPPGGSKDTIIFGTLRRKGDGTYDIDWGKHETSVVEEPPLDGDSLYEVPHHFYASTSLERQTANRAPSDNAIGRAVIDTFFADPQKEGDIFSQADRTPDLGSATQPAKPPRRPKGQHREMLDTLSSVSSAENLMLPSDNAYQELEEQNLIEEAHRQFDKVHTTPNSVMPSAKTITGTENAQTPHSIDTPYTVLTDGKIALLDENGEQAGTLMPTLSQKEQTKAALAFTYKTADQSEISEAEKPAEPQSENSQSSRKSVAALTKSEALDALNKEAVDSVTGEWLGTHTTTDMTVDKDGNLVPRPERPVSEYLPVSGSVLDYDSFTGSSISSSDIDRLPSAVPGIQSTPPNTDPNQTPDEQTHAETDIDSESTTERPNTEVTDPDYVPGRDPSESLRSRFQRVYTVTRNGDDDLDDDGLDDVGGDDEEMTDEFLAGYDQFFINQSEEDILKLSEELQRIYAQWVVKRKPIIDAQSNTEQNTDPPPESSEPSEPPIPPSHIEPFINHFAPGYDTVTGDLVWKVGFGFSGSFDTFADYVRYITDSICKRVQTEVTRRPRGNGKMRKVDKYEIIDAAGIDAQKRLYFRSNPGYVYCYWGHATPRMIRLLQAPYFFRNHHCSQLYWYLVCSTANSTEIKDDTYRILIGRHGFVNRAQEIVVISYDSIVIPGNSFFNPMWIEVRDENDELYPLQVPYILEWTFSPIKPA